MRRRSLWMALVLSFAAVGLAAYLAARSGGTAVRTARITPGSAGRPVDPAPGGHVSVVRPTGRPLRVLFVGDSLTAGRYAVRRDRAFPALVTAALRAHGPVTETVEAKSGVKAAYWASRPLPPADVVVIELGTNDFSLHLTPRAAFARDYERLVANVRAHSPHAKVLCLSLWRSSHYGYDGETLLAYNRTVAHECRGGAFVWISALYDIEGDRGPAGVPTFLGGSDAFHPNDAGHRAIAATIAQAVRIG